MAPKARKIKNQQSAIPKIGNLQSSIDSLQ
jgi:hypothetical protein